MDPDVRLRILGAFAGQLVWGTGMDRLGAERRVARSSEARSTEGVIHALFLVPGHFPRGIVTVPTSVVQNRQMITPQIVSHIPLTAGSMIEHPPFEPGPRPTARQARRR